MQGRPIDNKIVVRITNQSIEEIFSHEIVRNDGTTVKICINAPANEEEDRISTLYASTGIVEIGNDTIQKGDIAILTYDLFNDQTKILQDDENGRLLLVDPKTTYHEEDNIAFGNRNIPRQQIVWMKGEVNEMSQLLGIIRDGKFIVNDPFVLLYYKDEDEEKEEGMFDIGSEIIERKVFSISEKSRVKYKIDIGDEITIREPDIFEVVIRETKFQCCNDSDILMAKKLSKV